MTEIRRQEKMATKEEIETALDVLSDIERAEGDDAHKRDIADVRRMLVGVFDAELFLDDFEGDERVQTLKEVLDEVDPEDQHYTDDVETVEELKRSGQEFAEIYDR